MHPRRTRHAAPTRRTRAPGARGRRALRPATPLGFALEPRVLLSYVTELEGNNSFATANAVSVDVGDVLTADPAGGWLNITAAIGSNADADYYRFTVDAPVGLFIDLDSRETGLSATLDGVVSLYNATQDLLDSNDDGVDFDTGAPAPALANGLDSALYRDLGPGTYYVLVRSFSERSSGEYSLRMLADPNYTAAVPVFSSDPGAADTLHLDFDGDSATNAWGTYTAAPYSLDADPTRFSPGERLAIRNVVRTVSEDFSPFAINVSTRAPKAFADGVAFRQVVTMSDPAIVGLSPGTLGVAYLNSYALPGEADQTAFTFAGSFSHIGSDSSSRIMARAVEIGNTCSHEFGHALGLHHFVGAGPRGALMFTPDTGLNRETWHAGANAEGVFQDDMEVIASTVNTFGYRTDDHGDAPATATTLTGTAGTFTAAGLIGTPADVDVFRFTTAAGLVVIEADVDDYVNNLDVALLVYDAAGVLLHTSDPAGPFDAAVALDLPAGTYSVEVRSHGGPGEAGRYALRIEAPTGGPDNDRFNRAGVITGRTATAAGTNTGATGETDEPDHAGASNPLHSVWWSWTAPADGAVTIDTAGSSFDTTLAVYTGVAVDALAAVASNDDAPGLGLSSRVSFAATVGRTYRIAVDGFGGAVGDIRLNIALAAQLPSLSLEAEAGTGGGAVMHRGMASGARTVWLFPSETRTLPFDLSRSAELF